MKILIIGCGSAGERHTRNLLSLGQEISVYDTNPERVRKFVKEYGVSDNWKNPDAFIICTPPDSHLEYIRKAIDSNAHIFVEKPISNTLDGIEVINKAKEKNLILQVGYQFRFHPGLRLAKQLLDEGRIGKPLSIRAEFGYYLPYWHPQEDYRNLYTIRLGIILDSSHEIHYVRWLVGSEVSEVSCFAGHLSSLETQSEDIAEINLRFENNVIGNIHADYIQRGYSRWYKLIGEKGTILWDYNYATVKLFDDKEHHLMHDDKDMYLEEMKSFLSCIERKEKPIVDGETGKRVLEIALATKQSSRENKVIEL